MRLPKTGCETESQYLSARFGHKDQVTKRINPTKKPDANSSLDLAPIRFIITSGVILTQLGRFFVEQRLS